MSGVDWLVVAVLAGIVIVAVVWDGLVKIEDHRAERDARNQSHRRLMSEIEGKP